MIQSWAHAFSADPDLQVEAITDIGNRSILIAGKRGCFLVCMVLTAWQQSQTVHVTFILGPTTNGFQVQVPMSHKTGGWKRERASVTDSDHFHADRLFTANPDSTVCRSKTQLRSISSSMVLLLTSYFRTF